MTQTSVATYQNYINGEWVDSRSGELFPSVNPASTDDIVGYFQASTREDAEEAINAAQQAFPAWSKTSPSQRAAILNKAADLLESRVNQYAEELTREEGKPFSASKGEVQRSAQTLRYYAVEGLSLTGETFPNDDPNMMVYTVREPLGVVSVITPWNFPISIPSRKIAPALMTGNTVVFKPSSDTPLIGVRLVECLHEAGLPQGVLNFITGSASKVGAPLASHPAIKAISFTGSNAAGEAIHRSTALTTRTQMELGGKNPLVVMEDADLDVAVNLAINGGFSLTGQACTGTSRVIVMRSVQAAFVEKLVEKTKALRIGDGFMEGVVITPLANESQLNTVLEYIKIGQEEGAALCCGGEQLTEGEFAKGYYVTPAVFTDVTPSMRIAQEEIFGPVIACIAVDSYEEALQVANDVEYGLSSAIVTRDLSLAQRFTLDSQAGDGKS